MKRAPFARLTCAVLALLGSASAPAATIEQPAANALRRNGVSLNGPVLNGPGLILQGRTMNGPILQGVNLNGPGIVLQGTKFNGPALVIQGWQLNGPGLVLQGNRFNGVPLNVADWTDAAARTLVLPSCSAPAAGHSALSGLAVSQVRVRLAPR